MKTRYDAITPYVTKDGSVIRELIHPDRDRNVGQSLAEAIIPVAGRTLLHKHLASEEIYYIVQGSGLMRLGTEQFEVQTGDSIVIAPATVHNVENLGDVPLRILCCCAPAYDHNDTVIASEA